MKAIVSSNSSPPTTNHIDVVHCICMLYGFIPFERSTYKKWQDLVRMTEMMIFYSFNKSKRRKKKERGARTERRLSCERNAIHKVIYSTLYKSSRMKRINLNADTAIYKYTHTLTKLVYVLALEHRSSNM